MCCTDAVHMYTVKYFCVYRIVYHVQYVTRDDDHHRLVNGVRDYM